VTATDVFMAQRDQKGLRERKKRATREALHDAALRLTLKHGLEHLTEWRRAGNRYSFAGR
jgi:hypothetical protein